MFAITINEKGGETKRLEFDKAEVTIGRVQGNDIILPKGNVSKRHSRIVFKDGKFIIVDLKSTNGTYVNGRKITSPLVIKGTDKVYIGDFILSVEDGEGAVESAGMDAAPPAPPLPPPTRRPTMPPPPPRKIEARPTVPVSDPGALDQDDGMPPRANPFDDDAPPPPLAEPAGLAAPEDEEPRQPPPRPTASPAGRTMMPTPAATPAVRSDAMTPARVDAVPPPMEPPPSVMPQRPATSMAQPRPITSPPARSAPPPAAAVAAPARKPAPAPVPAASGRPQPLNAPTTATPVIAIPSDEAPAAAAMRQIVERLVARLGDRAVEVNEAERVALEIAQGIDVGDADRDTLARDAAGELVATGPLGGLLADPSVREVIVARYDRIFVDRDGNLEPTTRSFSSPDAVGRVVERMASSGSTRGGLVEARLADGSLLTAALPPLAARGATLTLRKPRPETITLAQLVTQGVLSQEMADLLESAVEARANIVVAGGPGTGRSTLVAAIANAVRSGERLISVEEREELRLQQGHWMQLTSRGGAREAIANALRLRPDRLVIDDVRGGEALNALEAAAAIPGVIIAAHGTSAADSLSRLEALALLVAGAPDMRAIREALSQHVQLVVQLAPRAGSPRVSQIAEVTGAASDGRPALADLFTLQPDGRFARGQQPSFAQR